MVRVLWDWRSRLLAVLTCVLYLGGTHSAINKTKIPAPSNLTATLEELFLVTWSWDTEVNADSERTCTLEYLSVVNDKSEQSMATVRRDTPHNLNDEMCFKVKSVCGNLTESEWVERCFYLLKGGGGELPVTDFKCTWYYEEPIHCTWHLETDAPPLAKYILMYRYDNTNLECQEYTHTQSPSNGCTFVNRKYDALDNINILITDSSMKLGRFYTSFDPHDILQSRPPSIKVSKSNDIDKIYVEWNDSMSEVKDYQVETKDSKSQKWTNYSVSNTNSFVISRARQDAMYTVRVRTKFDDHFGGKLWSDWSTEASIVLSITKMEKYLIVVNYGRST